MTEKTQAGPHYQEGRPATNIDVPATVPDPADGWPQRIAAALAARQARRDRLAVLRAEQAARRAHGLHARHAAKLRRAGRR
jgi:hypothetical protein